MPLILQGLCKQSDSAAQFLTLICEIWETLSDVERLKASRRLFKKVAGNVLPFSVMQTVF